MSLYSLHTYNTYKTYNRKINKINIYSRFCHFSRTTSHVLPVPFLIAVQNWPITVVPLYGKIQFCVIIL